MSEEKDNELWELLNDSPKEKAPSQERKSDSYAKKKSQRKAQKKIQVLTGVVAILSVSTIALGILAATRSAPADDSALQTRIQELEAENKALSQENASYSAENQELNQTNQEQLATIEDLNKLINQLGSDMEYAEGQQVNSNGEVEMTGTLDAYENLVNALTAMMTYDEATVKECLANLEGRVDHLTNDAQNAYYMVLEYMEQPYWFAQNKE